MRWEEGHYQTKFIPTIIYIEPYSEFSILYMDILWVQKNSILKSNSKLKGKQHFYDNEILKSKHPIIRIVPF